MTLATRLPDPCPAMLDGQPLKMVIDGARVEALSGETFDTCDPGTGAVLASVPRGRAKDVDRAVAAARRAFEGPWARCTPFQRQEMLLRLADLVARDWEELALLDVLDMGAPIAFVRPRLRRAVGLLRYHAGAATMIHGETTENSLGPDYVSFTRREPLGVVGAIIPWNAPVTSAIWKLAAALCTGCTVVLKPSEESPLSALRLADLIEEAGFPPGTVNIVTGHGHEAGAALAEHPDVNKISFTGSPATGQRIMRAAAATMKRLTMELGGKSPDIIFADADLDAAIPGAGMGVFGNSGQICMAGTRLFVERPVYEEVLERIVTFGQNLKVGYGLDPDTQIGPLVSRAQRERVTGYIASGLSDGARLLSGGEVPKDPKLAQGHYVTPTVFSDVREDMGIVTDEIFGPVLCVLPFDDPADLVRRANDTVFGLGSGLWTRDLSKAHQVAAAIRAGTVWVNCYGPTDPAVPFGGFGMSGFGRESGRESLDAYLQTKAVWIKTENIL